MNDLLSVICWYMCEARRHVRCVARDLLVPDLLLKFAGVSVKLIRFVVCDLLVCV